jgi:membrane-associated protein
MPSAAANSHTAILAAMDPAGLLTLLLTYRYWVLLPLAIVEGPMLAFACGVLVSLGYLSAPVTLGILVLGDIIPDTVFYTLGRFWSDRPVVQRLAARLGVTEAHLADARGFWHNHPGKTMLMSKFAYGISSAFLFMAGLMRMSALRFYGYSISISIAHYVVIMTAGYYFGASLIAAGETVRIIEYGVAGLALLVSLYVGIMWYMRSSFPALSDKNKAV